jgi:PAS domain S-box-containing protein
MFGYATFFWPMVVGICLYAGLMHLQIGLRRPVDRIHTLFGLLAVSVAAGVVANIELATAQTSSQYQAAAWLSSITATLVFIFLPWFASFYADEAHHRYAAALSSLSVIVLIGNFFHPYSMLLSAPPELHTIEYPWGERITRSLTPPTAWSQLIWITYGITVIYLLVVCVNLFRRGPRFRAWGLVLSAGPFAASLVINILVHFRIVNLPYVAAPGFLAMVVIMSIALTREWRRTHLKMQVVLDNVPAVVYLKRPDGRYVFVNRHFEQLYGLAAKHVIGKTDTQLFEAARAAQHAEAEREALSASNSVEREEIIDRAGKRSIYAIARFALRDHDGECYGVCGIATDVSDRKKTADSLRELAVTLERRVARRTNELSQLNRELEAFAYSVSHDLRAPLTAVNGFAELLLREHGPKLDQSGNRYINRIRDGSVRMAGLIQDLLGLSRVTQQSIERVPTDLAPIVEIALKTLREGDVTRSVSAIVPKTLPANGDPKLLALALNNLLANAWKYTSKTTDARIEVGSVEHGGEVVYFVKDNGAGFNSEYADRLFRPFVRLHSESEFPGTGIGLATVARIIGKHGGRIWAESRPNAGATFYFTLPVGDEELLVSTATYVESLGPSIPP